MRGSRSRRRAAGIRSTVPLASHQALLRGVALASLLGIGAVTGFGAAGLGPLAALAGDPRESVAEAGPQGPAPSDGGGDLVTGPSAPAPSEAGTPATGDDPGDDPSGTPTAEDAAPEPPAEQEARATAEAAQDDADSAQGRARGKERGSGVSDGAGSRGESSSGSWRAPAAGQSTPVAPSTVPVGQSSGEDAEAPVPDPSTESSPPPGGGLTPPADDSTAEPSQRPVVDPPEDPEEAEDPSAPATGGTGEGDSQVPLPPSTPVTEPLTGVDRP